MLSVLFALSFTAQSIPYREGQPIPVGAVVVEKPTLGLWVSGTVVLSLSWLLTGSITTYLCSHPCPSWAAPIGWLPVLGPVIDAFASSGEVLPFMISMALLQGAGAGLLIGGLVKWKKVLIMPTGSGMMMRGTF